MKLIRAVHKPKEQVREERAEAQSRANGPPKVKVSGMLELNGKRLLYLECLACGHTWQTRADPELATFDTEIGRSFLAGLCRKMEACCPCNERGRVARTDALISDNKVEP